jgi:uncharacterized protein YbjT (DUF2867 family)
MPNVTTLITAVPPRRVPGAVPTGPVGRQLARRLLSRGENVRVLAPEPEAAGWPDGTEVIIGSVLRPAESPTAFAGADRLFLAGATPESLWERPPVAVHDVVRRATEGGVRRIVVLSSHGPVFEVDLPPRQWYWLAVERAVEASGVAWTHIRPSAVMASMLADGYPPTGSAWAESIRVERVVREPNGDAAYPFLDEDDLAAVADTAFFDDTYDGSIVEALGAPVSARERVRLIADAIGEPVRFEELTPDQAREHWRRHGWPDETIEATLWAQARFLAEPLPPDHTIERILGRPPRTCARWVSDHADAFR